MPAASAMAIRSFPPGFRVAAERTLEADAGKGQFRH
jgi:hypothetical protein